MDKFLGRENLQLSAYARNVTDKEYVKGQGDFYAADGFINRQYAEPRTYGVALRYTF